VEYLLTPPDASTLIRLLDCLGLAPRELMRTSEDTYAELRLAEADDAATLIDAMVHHPELIERPIAVRGQQARLGRPPERVLELL
jgi:arsenate reductase (glutaredoxin)